MATLFCMLVLTLHKTVLYAFHRGVLRLYENKPAAKRVLFLPGAGRAGSMRENQYEKIWPYAG